MRLGSDGRLWVKVPSISTTTDTILYLYYDNAHADNTAYVGDTGSSPAQQVWANGFVAVYHFGQQGTGVKGEIKDSTSHHNDGFGGTSNSAKPPTLQTTNTKTGYAQYFGGIPDKRYIEIPDSPDFSCAGNGPSLSFSVWISMGAQNFPSLSNSNFARWMGKGSIGKAEYLWVFYNYDTSISGGSTAPRPGYRADWISLYTCPPSGGVTAGAGGPTAPVIGHTWAANEWMFVTDKLSSTQGNQWQTLNGNSCIYADPWSSYGYSQLADGSDPFRVGTDYFGSSDWWYGRIAELHVSNVFRSDAWDKADYNSQNDSLVRFGAAASNGTNPAPPPPQHLLPHLLQLLPLLLPQLPPQPEARLVLIQGTLRILLPC